MSRFDERKMKELADRMVAMSPEPPPFPEEVSVTQHDRFRPSPILVFAGAALVVLILAAIPLLLSRGGGEVDPVATTTTSPEATTSVPDQTTTTSPGQEVRGVVVYLVGTPDNSFLGNPALVPFFTNVMARPDDTPEEVALRTLTNPSLSPPAGFDNHVPADVEIVNVEDGSDGVRVVDMNQAFLQGAGSGALGDFTMLNQLIYTTTDEELFPEVRFTVGGEPVTQFGSEGLDISEPLDREAFIDQLNSVNLTSAITGSGSGPLVITGVANVFEATVSLELVDPDGNVVHEDFTTASCGTGCWGSFSFHIEDVEFETTPLTARVFWHSPEDGEPADVVSVPVHWGEGGWDFLP
jgi:spore germination protein GerM